ncbi:hypothetical protein [Luteimonas aquatica]|uniref:hypothetical protein n=1 Tax=Luteimonas aquatica TaxID=450364 RepID=UPI001F55E594|nr:hypothetical protein [Luteimonas aquatica]
MIVPRYWAEARRRHRSGGRQVTVRRFGWSDDSQATAQAHAGVRAEEAMRRILAGERLPRHDPKLPYNGAEGVPIREEVVDRRGDAVLSRNSYGALCLNTPDVLFVDIDFADPGPGRRLYASSFLSLLALATIAGLLAQSTKVAVAGAAIALLCGAWVAGRVQRYLWARAGGPERRAQRRLQAFLRAHPDWHVGTYRTPAGWRVLVLHRLFDPREEAVRACFDALGVDPVYARMCRRQHCFRARVTPKPWRIGMAAHLRPRPGVWPVRPEGLALRQRWVRQYELASAGYAACSALGEAGSGRIDAKAEAVREWHDDLCRAKQSLPIA